MVKMAALWMAIVSVMLAGCATANEPPEPKPWVADADPIDYYGYRAADRTLALSAQQGCGTFRFTREEVVEQSDAVIIDVTSELQAPPDGTACAASISHQTLHITLKAELGNKVVRTREGRVIERCRVFQPEGFTAEAC